MSAVFFVIQTDTITTMKKCKLMYRRIIKSCRYPKQTAQIILKYDAECFVIENGLYLLFKTPKISRPSLAYRRFDA